MSIDIDARVAALELLVEQLILERVQVTEDPNAAVRTETGRLTQIPTDRPQVPREAVGARADVLAQVRARLVEGGPRPLRWGGE